MFPPEDSFISDEEVEYCPLCVEEMDISDKNFRPCPCGYQICQFCYNNIRQNPELNGRCPGCRRLYDDESVEYKTLTAEEYKSQQIKKERRDREKKQREKEKKESELASKKHLAGLRVVQKNLVYVTGLHPPCAPEDLHSVLRSERYFGQYGRISKIVVNRKTPPHHLPGGQVYQQAPTTQNGIVVYVTFARKDDAARCISELDGSLCDGRVLRAAHGTTKYCSAYLRGHPCPNPGCMFLHEPGEDADSYTRKDLSTRQGIRMGMSGSRRGSSASGDDLPSDIEEVGVSTSALASTTPHNSGATPVATPVEGHAAPVLPVTAHWAQAPTPVPVTNANADASADVALANAAAFPTLGEIFKEQRAPKRDSKKRSRAPRDVSGNDDVGTDADVDSVLRFVDECGERMRALADPGRQLSVHFASVTDASRIAPFFHYDERVSRPQSTSFAAEKAMAVHVIERFLLRPMKKYHLAYSGQASGQQSQFLQQQAHFQQQQQPQPQQQGQGQATTPTASAQNAPFTNLESTASQSQTLMMQLQQQGVKGTQNPSQVPRQLSGQANQAPQLASHFNALRLSERSKTSTPPPPGLFAKSQDPLGQQQSSQGPPSSSSQLLTQLMSGKK